MAETLGAALAAFQAELPRIGKGNTANTGTYSYKYADLADISLIVLPLLGKHGLSFTSAPTLDDGGRFVLRYTLRHASGDSETGSYPLPSAGRPQEIGSAITYARRYALCAVTGVAADEDDDGAQAPVSSRQPAERHESNWDPAEQDALRARWESEIDEAKSGEEISEIGKKILAEKRSGEMSPATYQRLATYGGRRKGELDAAEQPATVTPAPDSSPEPDRRRRQLAAMDRAVEQRKEPADATS